MNLKTAASLIDKAFSDIIGQKAALMRLKEILLGGISQGSISSTILISPPGAGKTMIMNKLKELVKKLTKRKSIFFKRGEDTESREKFFESVMIKEMANQEAFVMIDEMHETPRALQMTIRSCIEIKRGSDTEKIILGAKEFHYNPKLHSFFLATNRIDEIDPALLSRLERVDLTFYSDAEMEQILQQELRQEKIQFTDNTLRSIAECNRKSARDVLLWVKQITRYLSNRGKNTISKKDAQEIIKSRDCYPLGLSRTELETLLFLEKRGELQLKELACLNLCNSKEQTANERYLIQRGLLTIMGKRILTEDGTRYLKELRKEGYLSV